MSSATCADRCAAAAARRPDVLSRLIYVSFAARTAQLTFTSAGGALGQLFARDPDPLNTE